MTDEAISLVVKFIVENAFSIGIDKFPTQAGGYIPSIIEPDDVLDKYCSIPIIKSIVAFEFFFLIAKSKRSFSAIIYIALFAGIIAFV
jgi:hypothetical protein